MIFPGNSGPLSKRVGPATREVGIRGQTYGQLIKSRIRTIFMGFDRSTVSPLFHEFSAWNFSIDSIESIKSMILLPLYHSEGTPIFNRKRVKERFGGSYEDRGREGGGKCQG